MILVQAASLHDNTNLGLSVTTATSTASKFSSFAYPKNSCTSAVAVRPALPKYIPKNPLKLAVQRFRKGPDNGSRIAPPRQVAAPPNGSISVG